MRLFQKASSLTMAGTGQRPFRQVPVLLLALAAALAVCSSVCPRTQRRLYRLRATGLLPNVTPAAIFSHVNSRALCVKACLDLLDFRCCALAYSAERKKCHAYSDPRAGDVTSAAPGFIFFSQGHCSYAYVTVGERMYDFSGAANAISPASGIIVLPVILLTSSIFELKQNQ